MTIQNLLEVPEFKEFWNSSNIRYFKDEDYHKKIAQYPRQNFFWFILRGSIIQDDSYFENMRLAINKIIKNYNYYLTEIIPSSICGSIRFHFEQINFRDVKPIKSLLFNSKDEFKNYFESQNISYSDMALYSGETRKGRTFSIKLHNINQKINEKILNEYLLNFIKNKLNKKYPNNNYNYILTYKGKTVDPNTFYFWVHVVL